jgi:hypothetical protein
MADTRLSDFSPKIDICDRTVLRCFERLQHGSHVMGEVGVDIYRRQGLSINQLLGTKEPCAKCF